MEIADQADSVVANLRRAALAGAIGDAADRPSDVLENAGIMSGGDRFMPSANPLAVAVDGQGFFVLDAGGGRVFSRLGDFHIDDRGSLVDSQGRAVIGFQLRADGTESGETPIAVNGADLASKRFASFHIDENGVLTGVVRKAAGFRRSKQVEFPIARLALAMFAAPERLKRIDETTLAATGLSGPASVVAPGTGDSGHLKRHALAAGAVDLEADLRMLWMLRRKGELEAALAGAADSCTRTALGLVR